MGGGWIGARWRRLLPVAAGAVAALLAACAPVAQTLGLGGLIAEPAVPVPGGDPRRGAAALRAYGCGACHVIPGLPGAQGAVGPSLARFSRGAYVAGNLSNTPANLIRWIQYPQAIEPGTAMPDLGVPLAEAQDMAAYLYTLR